jgi:hypothetical protein
MKLQAHNNVTGKFIMSIRNSESPQ